jgi:hypothetical protein
MTPTRPAHPSRLALAALVLPALLAACVAETGDDESTAERDEAITENANDKIAFDYFVAKGLTDVQAAGIVGNLDQESEMNPKAVQPGGPGRGIAQWSQGDRWNAASHDNVAWYAAKQGGSAWSLHTQLDFIWYELTTIGYGFDHLKAAKTITQAVTAFQDHFEMCGQCASSNRIAHAKAALAQFGGQGPQQPASPDTCSVDGVDGTCIETAACAAKPGHVSTPGYCPGGASIECCTAAKAAPPSPDPNQNQNQNQNQSPDPAPPSGPSCSVGGVAGTCIDVSACDGLPGYVHTAGHCPGGANEQCCTPPPCHVNGVAGSCIDVGLCASAGHSSTPGYCGGPANIECCTN